MLHRMSSEELTEWQIIHDKLEPFGAWRDDIRAGQMISPIINLMRAYLLKNPTWTKPSDWVMDFAKPVKPEPSQSPAHMKAVLKGLSDAAKIKAGGSKHGR